MALGCAQFDVFSKNIEVEEKVFIICCLWRFWWYSFVYFVAGNNLFKKCLCSRSSRSDLSSHSCLEKFVSEDSLCCDIVSARLLQMLFLKELIWHPHVSYVMSEILKHLSLTYKLSEISWNHKFQLEYFCQRCFEQVHQAPFHDKEETQKPP